MMLFKTKGEESILRTLHDLSVRWEALQAAKQTECAKRIALFKGMILELQARAKSFMEQETKLQSLIQLGWVTKQDQREPIWQPLVWSVEQQKDIPCPDMGPSSAREDVAGHGGVDRAYKRPGNPPIPMQRGRWLRSMRGTYWSSSWR